MNTNIIFYDGNCALCHGWVKFVLYFDTKKVFMFSPLQGETISKEVSEEIRKTLPDSIVVLDDQRTLHLKSDAVIYILSKLNFFLMLLAKIINIIPSKLRDYAYDLIATYRKKILGTKEEICPIVPTELSKRFLL